MTLDEIRTSGKAVLFPADVAEVLGCDAQWIRKTAKENPEQLGFPVIRMGTRTRIPRIPFIQFMDGNNEYF